MGISIPMCWIGQKGKKKSYIMTKKKNCTSRLLPGDRQTRVLLGFIVDDMWISNPSLLMIPRAHENTKAGARLTQASSIPSAIGE